MSNSPLFQEIYSCYYGIIASSLSRLGKSKSIEEVRKIIAEEAAKHLGFADGADAVFDILTDKSSALLISDNTYNLNMPPELPLTLVQKRWMKSLLMDPRIQLFEVDSSDLDDIEPLFTPDSIVYYDQYIDGDNYNDSDYKANFKLLLDAIKNHQQVRITKTNSKGKTTIQEVYPFKLEYSLKDDKFRALVENDGNQESINLSSIISVEITGNAKDTIEITHTPKMAVLELELTNRNDALNRCMNSFSDYRKETTRIDDEHYIVNITYDASDERELIIRVLQFGTAVKVIGPEKFRNALKERIFKQ